MFGRILIMLFVFVLASSSLECPIYGALSSWMQTSDTDFAGGIPAGVAITGVGQDASVVLEHEVFSYKRESVIDNLSGAELSDYQVKIALKGSNFDFSRTRADGSDIRFLDSDDSSPLDFWTESWDSASQTATVWVKVPLIPAGAEKTLFIYYGSATVPKADNGIATFELFDDFENLTAWTQSGNTISVSNGIVTFDSGSNPTISRNFSISPPFIAEVKYQHPSRYRNRLYLTTSSGTSTGYDYGIFDPSIYWNGLTGVNLNINTWYIVRWENTSNNYIWRILNLDGTEVISRSHGSAIANLQKLIFSGTESTNSDFKLDWVRVRKYASSEPTVTIESETPANNKIIYKLSGDFISSSFDTGQLSNFATLSWDANIPGGTDLRFQIRTANTESELSSASWYGPAGTSDYYTASGDPINLIHNGRRWIQYKAFFETDAASASPLLNSVSITYEIGDSNISTNTNWPEGDYHMNSLTVSNGATLTIDGGSTINVTGTLTVIGNSTIVLKGQNTSGQINGKWQGTGVTINAGNLTIDSGSKISADGQGYVGGKGSGVGASDNGTHGGGGGGYGGVGGTSGDGINAGGPPYGSAPAPVDLGSGGGPARTAAGSGGGALKVTVTGTFTLNGMITANGTDASNGNCFNAPAAGGGAGGSIFVTTATLAGTGSLRANGGAGGEGGCYRTGDDGGGGAGGRIAVYYGVSDGFAGFTTSSISGGASSMDGGTGYPGATGTMAFINTATNSLRVSQNLEFPADSSLTFGGVMVENGARLTIGGGSTIDVTGTLTVTGNSTIVAKGKYTAGQNSQWQGAGVTINAANIIIDAGSKISADGQGYHGGAGPGVGSSNGAHPGGGGGYGGSGGYGGQGVNAGGSPYGSALQPLELGSGGGHGTSAAGNGGGAIFLYASGTLTLNGAISANGNTAASVGVGSCVSNAGGGGSGGSICISAVSLIGSGSITANGGNGGEGGCFGMGDNGGGGGGGRVALYYWNGMSLPAGNIVTAAGTGANNGQTGTVVIEDTPHFVLTGPTDSLLHGTERIRWAALGVDIANLTADIFVSGSGVTLTLGSGLSYSASLDWDTRTVLDGTYEIRAVFRDASSQPVGEATRTVLVNNSVAWHSGRIETSQTWAAGQVHVVEGDVIVTPGVRLIIEPGAIVKFARGAKIIVEAGGILDAPATEGAPIIFTSLADDTVGGDTNLDDSKTLPIPGDWVGLITRGTGQVNLSGFVSIRYIVNSHTGQLSGDENWLSTIVHHLTGDIVVPGGVTLTIQPGAVVKFDQYKGITVQAGGKLIAEGLLAQPIYFTSIKDDSMGGDTNEDGNATSPASGDWRWIYVEGQAIFNHTIISYGGGTSTGSWDSTGMIRTAFGNASVNISNSILREAFFDGVLAYGGEVRITNTVLTGIDRAVCAHPGSPVYVTNSTLDNNRIGLLVHGGTMYVSNTIVTNSIESGIQYDFGGLASVSHSNVWAPAGSSSVNYRNTTDLTGTNGNISADPLYKNRTQGNYRLNYRSPCIDAADGSAAPETDFMGAPRYDDPRTLNTGTLTPTGAYADMGAYEFVETAESDVDLVVTSVIGPTDAVAGETATIQWTITNIGTGTVVGPWHDTVALVYRSGENPAVLVADQVLVGQGVTLGPGQSYEASAQIRVPGGIVGQYRWQVETNTRGEIFEGQNRANNTGYSQALVSLNLPELTLSGQAFSGQFTSSGESFWFKLASCDQDFLLALDSANNTGVVELYVGRGYMPTREVFDVKMTEQNSPDVTALIPCTPGQTYYVLVYVLSLPGGSNPFTIQASVPGFGLTSVKPNVVGNRGPVTLELRGGKLNDKMTYEIVGLNGVTRPAALVSLINSTLVYLTFDMVGLSNDIYDIRALNQSGTGLMLDHVLRVEEGGGPDIWVDIIGREIIRVGREYRYEILYGNQGNTDAYGTFIFVSGVPNDAEIQLGPEFMSRRIPEWNPTQRPLYAQTDNGIVTTPIIAQWLQPGSSGTASLTIRVPNQTEFSMDAFIFQPSDLSQASFQKVATRLHKGIEDIPIESEVRRDGIGPAYNELTSVDEYGGVHFLYPSSETTQDHIQNTHQSDMNALYPDTDKDGVEKAVEVAKANWGKSHFINWFYKEACVGSAHYQLTNLLNEANKPGSPLKGWSFIRVHKEGSPIGHTTVLIGSPWHHFYIIDGYVTPTAIPVDEVAPNQWVINEGYYRAGFASISPYAWLDGLIMSTNPNAYSYVPYYEDPWFKPGCSLYKSKWYKSKRIKTSGAIDPNIKVGFMGGQGYISGKEELRYSILFENLETATAPAQRVIVTDHLDQNLDWSTFQLSAIGFNKINIPVPSGFTHYEATVNVTTDPNPVKVAASFDPASGIIIWVMESVDPVTGGLPEDPLAGFLPPNDESQRGEGFVSFTVKPKSPLPSGTQISNQASITFDVNAPINTNTFINTIDADPPTSSVDPLPATLTTLTFTVSWSGSDTGGSGIVSYDIWVKDGSDIWTPWLLGTPEISGTFTGQEGHTYAFYSIARDGVGNRELPPLESDAVTTIVSANNPPIIPSLPSPSNGAVNVSLNVMLTWQGGDPDIDDTVNYDVFLDTVNPPLNKVSSNQSGTSYQPPVFTYNTTYYWKIVARDNNGAETAGPVWSFTTLSTGNDIPVADNKTVTTPEDASVGITLSGSDMETAAANLTFTVTSLPAHGTLSGTAPNLTYMPNFNYNGTDSFTYTVTDRGAPDNCGTPGPACAEAKTSGPATVSITVSPVNDPPEINYVIPETQTFQYSDRIAKITISATDIDSTDLTATAAGLPNGLVLGSKTCTTYDVIVGVSCTWTIEGAVDAPAGTYNISIVVSDSSATVNKGITLKVEPEEADVEFSTDNPVAVKVANPGGNSGTFSLIAFVAETVPDLPQELASPGEISFAHVSMTLQPVGIGASQTGTCTAVHDGTGYYAFLRVTCNFNNVPVNTYTVQVTVNGGYYEGYGEDVLVVYDPSLGFATGGGWFYWPGTANLEMDYPGDRTNFGFTMKYNKRQSNVQGSLLLIRHLLDGTIYRVKSNALYGLSLGSSRDSAGPFGWASFSGKSTYLEPDWLMPIGNYEFTVYGEDRNQPGNGRDRLWIEIKDRDRTIDGDMSMRRPAKDNAVELQGGNIVAPH